MKAHGDVNAKVHIYTATALGRGRVADPKLGRLYPGESHSLILLEAEWTPEPVLTRRNEEKSPRTDTWDRTRAV